MSVSLLGRFRARSGPGMRCTIDTPFAEAASCRAILILPYTCPMSQPVPLPPPGFDELSVDEKIDYLQSLWDRIAATPETVPVPDWHREILDQRLKDLEANPESGDSWDVVQERLRRKLDKQH